MRWVEKMSLVSSFFWQRRLIRMQQQQCTTCQNVKTILEKFQWNLCCSAQCMKATVGRRFRGWTSMGSCFVVILCDFHWSISPCMMHFQSWQCDPQPALPSGTRSRLSPLSKSFRNPEMPWTPPVV